MGGWGFSFHSFHAASDVAHGQVIGMADAFIAISSTHASSNSHWLQMYFISPSNPLKDSVQEKQDSQSPLAAINKLLHQLHTRLGQGQDRWAALFEDHFKRVSYLGGTSHFIVTSFLQSSHLLTHISSVLLLIVFPYY